MQMSMRLYDTSLGSFDFLLHSHLKQKHQFYLLHQSIFSFHQNKWIQYSVARMEQIHFLYDKQATDSIMKNACMSEILLG